MDPNLRELVDEAKRLSDNLDEALAELRKAGLEEATAERDYRKAVAQAWLVAPEGTVPERQAWVRGETADKRYRRDNARARRRTANQSLESRQKQISLLQSELKAYKAEADVSSYGPERGP